MADAKGIAKELTNGAKALLINTPDDAQIYDYTSNFMLQLREHKLVDEYWTWASNTRPGIQRNELGREVARHCKVKDRGYA